VSDHDAIPLGDAAVLRRGARSVRLARWVAAVVLVGAALLAFLAARNVRPETRSPIPASSTGIVVLDLSASISSDTYARIAATLDRLAGSDGSYGLILFSDTAYMALPPRSPASELRPFVRFFQRPRQTSPGALPATPRSPWTDAFSAGTSISTGLKLALDVIRADRLVRPAVLLVSDLDDSVGDVPRVSELAVAYRRAGIGLHVVGLDPEPEDLAFIRSILPEGGSFTQAALPGERSASFSRRSDTLLAVAALLAALALTAFVLTTAPLRWSTA
jgi:hypothetical protein